VPLDRVLIIDDDVQLCELLAARMEGEGFEIEAVHDGRRGLERALSHEHALIVLDLMLPGMGGLDVLHRVRQQVSTPVLILTARGADADRIFGLEIGADDYVPKPFNPRELMARIRAILRRTSRATVGRGPITVGEIHLDPASQEVWIQGRMVALTSVEFALLEMLMQRAGQIVSREEITETILGRKLGPFDRVIDVHVSNIRKKLGTNVERIKAIRGSGYMLASRTNAV
jgi:DNA-binding response OmpR family regulator